MISLVKISMQVVKVVEIIKAAMIATTTSITQS